MRNHTFPENRWSWCTSLCLSLAAATTLAAPASETPTSDAADPGTESKTEPIEPTPAEPSWVDFDNTGARLDVDFTASFDRVKKLLLGAGEDARAGNDGPDDDDGSLTLLVLPDFKFNPDEGLGFGTAIPVIWNQGGVRPYKYSLILQLVTGTKLIQDHTLVFDLVELFSTSLRLSGRAGFYGFADEPFCGLSSTATCDPEVAQAQARARGLVDEAAEDFADRYYLMRLVRPYLWWVARYEILPASSNPFGKWEVWGGMRSEWYVPGFFGNVFDGNLFNAGPYEGSAFAQYAPDGEPGFINQPQLGLMLDTRDFEPTPRRGYWIEASVRGAHPWLLSSWGFLGANLTARFYAPLGPADNVTVAYRFIADGIIGDAPVQELARFGGSQAYRGFGGRWVGRGMRQQRNLGHIKIANQIELRWDALRLSAGSLNLGFELISFIDAGVVLADKVDYSIRQGLLKAPSLLITGGFGGRMIINRSIVMRADIGFSAQEGWNPLFYFDGGHIY